MNNTYGHFSDSDINLYGGCFFFLQSPPRTVSCIWIHVAQALFNVSAYKSKFWLSLMSIPAGLTYLSSIKTVASFSKL